MEILLVRQMVPMTEHQMVEMKDLEMDYKMYIDIFLDFHKKWRELNKKHDNPYPWWSQD